MKRKPKSLIKKFANTRIDKLNNNCTIFTKTSIYSLVYYLLFKYLHPFFNDLLAVFALLAGTATTFSVATPLMATIISELFHVAVSRTVINIIILLITCAVYTYSLLHGFKGISKLANICIYMFFGLIAFVLLFGGETRYIIETGFSSLGRMIQNFVDLSTFTDPLRTSNFPQNWTIYYCQRQMKDRSCLSIPSRWGTYRRYRWNPSAWSGQLR